MKIGLAIYYGVLTLNISGWFLWKVEVVHLHSFGNPQLLLRLRILPNTIRILRMLGASLGSMEN